MTLGRMVQFFVPEQRLIKISAQRFGLIFVCLDIFAFIIQLIGVAILVQTGASNDTVLRGVHIYMGGIAIQETFIIGFIGLTIHLHRKLLHLENTGQQLGKMANPSFNWRWLFYTMYIALTMITVSEHDIPSQKSSLVFLTLFLLHTRFASLSDWQSIHMEQVQTSLQTHMSGTNMFSTPFPCSSPSLSSTYSTPAAFSRDQMEDFDTRRKSLRWKRSRKNSRKKTDFPPLATTYPWLRIRINNQQHVYYQPPLPNRLPSPRSYF